MQSENTYVASVTRGLNAGAKYFKPFLDGFLNFNLISVIFESLFISYYLTVLSSKFSLSD